MATPNDEEVEDPMDKALKELFNKAEDPRSYEGEKKRFSSATKARVQKVNGDRVKQFLAVQETR